MSNIIRLGFLTGGVSFEHEFTLKSLNYLVDNIYSYHSNIIKIKKIYYISKDNDLYVYTPKWFQNIITSAFLIEKGEKFDIKYLAKILLEDRLFIFSLLQGLYGEDGHIQALSYLYQIPGNLDNVLSAAVASNKWVQSTVANSSCQQYLKHIKTEIVHTNSSPQFDKILSKFKGANCILKPNSLGGSIMVKSFEKLSVDLLKRYLKDIKYFDKSFLIQERIFGQEIACCCLIDKQKIRLLPILKVNKEGALMDFKEKYKKNKYKWEFYEPQQEIQERLEIICKKINDILQFNTFCRFDFIIRNNDIFLLEVNNIPGIYEKSLFNRSLKKAGLNVSDLIFLTYKNWYLACKQNRLISKKIKMWKTN